MRTTDEFWEFWLARECPGARRPSPGAAVLQLCKSFRACKSRLPVLWLRVLACWAAVAAESGAAEIAAVDSAAAESSVARA